MDDLNKSQDGTAHFETLATSQLTLSQAMNTYALHSAPHSRGHLNTMSNPFQVFTQATPQHRAFALLLVGALPASCPAQDQTGSSLILETGKNHAPSEPSYVLTSGGPTGDQAKNLLKQRIQEQSEGKISLFGFRQITVRPLDLELNGKLTCAVLFEAGIEFDVPCAWDSRYQGRPLTFVILKADTDRRGTDNRQVFQIKAKGERYVFQGYAIFTPITNGWTLAGFGQSSRPTPESIVPDEASVECVTRLKMIGLAFKTWALDNNDHFPFNVSTNAGGTMEFCALSSDGYDASAATHFQVMSNELSTATILICPGDSATKAAVSFSSLQASNVTYLVRSGSNVEDTTPEEILVRCPIHDHVLRCDGSVLKDQADGAVKRNLSSNVSPFPTQTKRISRLSADFSF